MKYSFRFVFKRQTGIVEVFPAGAFVVWGGMGAHIDNLRGDILLAILRAKLAHSRTFGRVI